MTTRHSSYEELAAGRRASDEYREGYAEARRAFLIGQAVRERRLARLVEYGLLTGFWAANRQRPRGRYAYALTRATRAALERMIWPVAGSTQLRYPPGRTERGCSMAPVNE